VVPNLLMCSWLELGRCTGWVGGIDGSMQQQQQQAQQLRFHSDSWAAAAAAGWQPVAQACGRAGRFEKV
jgi:hypothetical protein